MDKIINFVPLKFICFTVDVEACKGIKNFGGNSPLPLRIIDGS